jgi:dynein heavy chain
MTAILKSLISDKAFKDLMKNHKEEDQKLVYENFFIYAGIWAIGAPIGDERMQSQFSTWWKSVAKKFPEAGTCYDFYYDAEKLCWMPW